MAHAGERLRDPGALLSDLFENPRPSVAGDVVVPLHRGGVAYTRARLRREAERRATSRPSAPDDHAGGGGYTQTDLPIPADTRSRPPARDPRGPPPALGVF